MDYLGELKKELESIFLDFKLALLKIRTGKPSIDDLKILKVRAYESEMELKDLATFLVEGMVINVNVFDRSILGNVVSALQSQSSSLGATVSSDGVSVKLKFHPLTEEERVNKINQLSKLEESFKVRMRLKRQDTNSKIKSDKTLREDDRENLLSEVQRTLDNFVEQVSKLADEKKAQIKEG
ncbi:ribosome-recycling factor [Candidatus Dojkabacteria bacterium]|uniref:Ribosome-recycling factor n=1 Tax=Candidatus Dojkabacteria bacterium TaxID=2099670 RepID=A0A3M0Z042_9BACT|nr:MAG: ribosome-recycling factor [Candidatus Dojkabacteria bacterium]